MLPDKTANLEEIKKRYPQKFQPERKIFSKIKRGARIFVSSACAEPQYTINALKNYIESEPKAFTDAEVFQVWTMGVVPYTDVKYQDHFRHNAFFIGMNARQAVNEGFADYTPVLLSQTPELFYRRLVPIDVAIIQTSPPDLHGYMSLGVSVDITKAAVENAALVIAQVNAYMPRVHGDGFIHIKDTDFLIHQDEPIMEFPTKVADEISARIGKYAARIINDGDTIQVGYGAAPNAIMTQLRGKKHLGVHTELLTEGLINLMKEGVIDNSQKTISRGKSIATFCMGTKDTYNFIHRNPTIEFKSIDYVNNPLVIARHRNMTAINSALQIDLTGQATAESLGHLFFSGIGGSADFMRGSALAPGGKSILLVQSTAHHGEISRIVPFLDAGAGVTLGRGDLKYVVTEYGIAYLYGKNIRERAMALIAIAHPKFRPWLIEEAKKRHLIYKDQAFIPGERGVYPESLETRRETKTGLNMLMRPVKLSDEPLLKDFFYSLSDASLYHRFISPTFKMPHERLQEFVVIDYTKDMVILAAVEEEGQEVIAGIGQYLTYEDQNMAEAAFLIRDDYQGKGVGTELLKYLTYLAVKQGLEGFTAEVVMDNTPMIHLFEKMDFDLKKKFEANSYIFIMKFKIPIPAE